MKMTLAPDLRLRSFTGVAERRSGAQRVRRLPGGPDQVEPSF